MVLRIGTIRPRLTRLARSEDGAVLVEFALVFPVMLLFFVVIVEATRMLWSYQMAVEGVRDASRYLARVAPVDICNTGGSLAGYTGTLRAIVENGSGGGGLFPPLVTVDNVWPSLACEPGNYRTDPAPIGTVTADITITFPFGGVFRLFGGELTSVTAILTDSSRLYGQ